MRTLLLLETCLHCRKQSVGADARPPTMGPMLASTESAENNQQMGGLCSLKYMISVRS